MPVISYWEEGIGVTATLVDGLSGGSGGSVLKLVTKGVSSVLSAGTGAISLKWFTKFTSGGSRVDLGNISDVISLLGDLNEGRKQSTMSEDIYNRWNAAWKAGTWSMVEGSEDEFTTISDEEYYLFGGPIKMTLSKTRDSIAGSTRFADNQQHFFKMMGGAETAEQQEIGKALETAVGYIKPKHSSCSNFIISISEEDT